MKRREPVSHIMAKNVITVQENSKLRDAISVIQEHHIHHLPVTSGGKVSGILTSSDVNRIAFPNIFDNQEGANEALLDMLSIKQLMTSSPDTVSSETPIREVADIFASSGYHALPVVDNEQLVGIVTTTDVIKYMLEQY